MDSRLLLVLSVIALPAFAQNTLKETMARHWKVSGEFTLAVADLMPEDAYTFRPNPEEMTFGQLMGHIGAINMNACANASGLARPELPPAAQEWSKQPLKVDLAKAAAMRLLKESFAFCEQAVAAMTPEKWDTVQGQPNRKLTGLEWLWGYFTHTAHHRGQAEVYLRVKGIKPPEYRF